MRFSYFLKDSKADDSLLYLVARMNNSRIKISTGMFVNPKSWNSKAARIKKNHAGQELNIRLEKIDSSAKEYYNEARNLGIEDEKTLYSFVKSKLVASGLLDRRNTDFGNTIQKAFKLFIAELEQGSRPTNKRATKQGKVSYSYLQVFKTLQTVLNGDEDQKGLLPENATFPHLQSKTFCDKFHSYRTDHWSDNTARKYLLALRRFMLWSRDSHIYNFLEFPKCLDVPKENESTLFALTDSELIKIESLDLSKRPSLDRVRDLFLISCFTGLRFSDVSRLAKEHIGATDIRISSQKTADAIRCPITPRLRAVLDRYTPNYEFPRISSQRANDHLKTIATLAEITDTMEIVSFVGGKKQIEVKAKNELIAWHCSRRTFITVSLMKGAPQAAVQAVSGHKKDSKSFNKYVLYSESQINDTMLKVWS